MNGRVMSVVVDREDRIHIGELGFYNGPTAIAHRYICPEDVVGEFVAKIIRRQQASRRPRLVCVDGEELCPF